MERENKRKIGSYYEEKAADWLVAQGYRILERNFRCGQGEIDLIAARGNELVFVEVKFRTDHGYGFSQEAVDVRKQRRIRRVAEYYVMLHPQAERMDCRYDVAAFEADGELRYFPGAFGGM